VGYLPALHEGTPEVGDDWQRVRMRSEEATIGDSPDRVEDMDILSALPRHHQAALLKEEAMCDELNDGLLDELISASTGAPAPKPASNGGPGFNEADILRNLLEYWTAEVRHLEAQKQRLMKMGMEQAMAICVERLRNARTQQQSLGG